jgi:hypothetical protein
MWIVKLALDRPYTFVVVAALILLLGVFAIITTPTDIFPNIDIPVISVIWVPGVETGVAEYTDKRSCWTRTLRSVFQVMARSKGFEMREPGVGGPDSDRQLKLLWYDGDALLPAARSGWGERSDLEQSFANLLLLKSPQKVLLYTCLKWQEAVIDQLTAALMRFMHHIEGEQYIAINLLAAQGKVYGMMCEVPHSGPLDLKEASFVPIQGSPYSWRLVESTARK